MAPCKCPRAAPASVTGARAAAPAPPSRYHVPKRGQVLKRAFRGLLAWLPLPPRRGWWLSRRGRRRASHAHGRHAKGAAAASASRLG